MNTYNTQRLIHEFQKQGGYSQGIDAEQLDREFDLVAAAPDLLAALEKAQRFIASTAVMLEGRGPVPEIVLLDIQNAIAKAKGE